MCLTGRFGLGSIRTVGKYSTTMDKLPLSLRAQAAAAAAAVAVRNSPFHGGDVRC